MAFVTHENPEDIIPTRYEIENELAKAAPRQFDQNVVAMRARNKQRNVNVRAMFKARGLSEAQIAKVLSDLPTYENYENPDALEIEQRKGGKPPNAGQPRSPR